MRDLDQMTLVALEAGLKRLGYPTVSSRHWSAHCDSTHGGYNLPRCSVVVHHPDVGAASANGDTLPAALALALDRFEILRRNTCYYCLRPRSEHPHPQCGGEGPGRFTSLEDKSASREIRS